MAMADGRSASSPAVVVNGKPWVLADSPQQSLLALLRTELSLAGTKPGCGEGECGACTVLVDGSPVLACQTTVAGVTGKSVTTIEGLAAGDRLHPVQQALVAERAGQCGYCAPGMVLRAAALLAAVPEPMDAQIGAALQPNVCRCGCYPRILSAVHRAAELPANTHELGGRPVADPPFSLFRPRRPWDLCEPLQWEWLPFLAMA